MFEKKKKFNGRREVETDPAWREDLEKLLEDEWFEQDPSLAVNVTYRARGLSSRVGTNTRRGGGNVSACAVKHPPSWRGRRWTGCSRNASITLPVFPRPPPPPAHTHPSSHLSSALSWKRQKDVQHPTNSPVIMQQHSDLGLSPI